MPEEKEDRQKEDEHAKAIMKEAMQSAISDWLDKKFQDFGRWTFYGVSAAALAALLYFILKSQGWRAPV